MADLSFIAAGFGVLPFSAILLYAAPGWLRRHEAAAWGAAVGAVAFLGLAHAGAAVLEGHAYLVFEASPVVAAATAAGGLLLGIGLGWLLIGRTARNDSAGLAWLMGAAAAYVALHSLSDGIVLGEAYAGPAPIGFDLTVVVVGGTLLHRFAEGALVVVPGTLGNQKLPRPLGLLLAGLLTIPAAFLPLALLGTGIPPLGSVAWEQGLSVFASAAEAGFAVIFLILGLLPRIQLSKDRRWALWAALAFVAMFLVHFLVE